MSEDRWKAVTKAEFFAAIGNLDVHPQIQPPAKYPFTELWKTPGGMSRGKSVGVLKGGKEITEWYLPNRKL